MREEEDEEAGGREEEEARGSEEEREGGEWLLSQSLSCARMKTDGWTDNFVKQS